MGDAVPLLTLLTGADRRSIGRVLEVVAMVLAEPALLAQLIAGMCHADPVVAMRASDAAEKLTAYLLNMSHKRGAAKARLLLSLGYRSDAAHVLESDLRAQHLSLEVTRTRENAYGVVYEIVGPIKAPNGSRVQFCSVWQVDTGTDVPRFITMYPR